MSYHRVTSYLHDECECAVCTRYLYVHRPNEEYGLPGGWIAGWLIYWLYGWLFCFLDELPVIRMMVNVQCSCGICMSMGLLLVTGGHWIFITFNDRCDCMLWTPR